MGKPSQKSKNVNSKNIVSSQKETPKIGLIPPQLPILKISGQLPPPLPTMPVIPILPSSPVASKPSPEIVAREMIEGLRDKKFPLDVKVVKILGETRQKTALRPLLKALHDKSYDGGTKYTRYGEFRTNRLNQAAAEAIGKLGDKKAVEPLIKVMMNKSLDPDLRVKVIEALSEISDISASDALLDILLEEAIPEVA
jgi:HEAT repeat protein